VSVLIPHPFCIIQRGKEKSLDLARAVIKGCGNGGDIHYEDIHPDEIHEDFTPVVIGVHPSTVDTLWALRRARRPFVTIDNGYFRPYREGGYFRATTNALQWIQQRGSWIGRPPLDDGVGAQRFAAMGMPAETAPDWRRDGEHILIALQSPVWLSMMGEYETWLSSVVQTLQKYTDRRIAVRSKPLKGSPPMPPLDEHLDGAWAVVAYSSNVLIKAALKGIPVFPTALCAASPLGCSSLEMINEPRRPDTRMSIFHDLAANQWTIDEISSGRMWADLQARYHPEFMPLS
jgi:hypothetical protein